MSGIQKLIETILSTAKHGDKGGQEKVYRDEPILMTASQMKNYTPPRYRQMRKIAKDAGIYYDYDARLFYEQGKFMEDFEDDFEFNGEFVRYFPTYQAMNDRELRGYFSWRTKLRKGWIEKTSLSFAFVYIYELINQIGAASAEEGYFKLRDFWTAYRELDPRIDRYMAPWMQDYVVYYDLDASLLAESVDQGLDRARLTLLHFRTSGADQVFDALNSLSSYNMENSRFFKKYPEDVKQVVYNVLGELAAYYEKNRKGTLWDKFFGRIYSNPHTMFQSAVFFDRIRRRSFVYEISQVHKYRCENGRWLCERYFKSESKNKEIGALLKNIDFEMRRRYDFKSNLKGAESTKIFLDAVRKEVEKYWESKEPERPAAPEIEIDLSVLDSIRRTSLKTQSKLIVEGSEEAEKELYGGPEPWAVDGSDGKSRFPIAGGPQVEKGSPGERDPADESGSQMETGSGNGTGLDDAEYGLLRCLLHGEDWGGLLRSRGLLLSVLVDSINEKLFDVFSDTVILFDGERPELIEDYIDELKGMIEE